MDDEQFKSEMLEFKSRLTRFTEVAEQKFDGLITDVRTISIRLDKVEQRIDNLASDHNGKFAAIATKIGELSEELKTLSKRFSSADSAPFRDTQRLARLEERVGLLEDQVR